MGYTRLLVAGSILCMAVPVRAQSPIRVELHGRMHYQWNTTSVRPEDTASGAAIAPSTFEHRRARLSADVYVSDWIHGRIEPEFAMGGSVRLRHAWVALALDDAVTVRAGQFKKPFNLIQLVSGSHVPLIERSVRIRSLDAALRHALDEGVLRDVRGEVLLGEEHALLDVQRYTGYDMGLAVEVQHRGLGVSAGVFNGQGSDVRDENAGLSGAARVSWRSEPGTPVTLAGGWSRRVLNWPQPSSTETRSGNAFGADIEVGGFRRAGMWLLGEVMMGDNLASGERMRGAHVMAALHRPTGGKRLEAWEPVGRVSWGDPDSTVDGDDGVLLTPGFNLYFAGRNRLMLNWDVYLPGGAGLQTQHAARAQINLEF
jgi:hypothetical protein